MLWREQAHLLLRKARQDVVIVARGVADVEIGDEVIGFHVQQAGEKCMKTELSTIQARLTITIPEHLRRRAKAQAALEGTTLSQVIRKRLEEFAPDWEVIEDAQDLRAAEEIEARIARGEEELRDWAEVDAELDALNEFWSDEAR
jgi:NADPH:quinone reductase-like Zn-dependent oxidoreductase